MINEDKLRELFGAKLQEVYQNLNIPPQSFTRKFFEWFKFGFEASYQYPPTLIVADPLTPEKREAILKATEARSGHIVVEPDNKLIFVYSWYPVQQRTMIILADSREEADSIFNDQFEKCAEFPNHFVPTHYVTQLFVDGNESTIIYNN